MRAPRDGTRQPPEVPVAQRDPSLVPALWITVATMAVSGVLWIWIEAARASLATLTLLVGAAVLAGLALRYRTRPPRSASFPAAAVIGLLYLCAMAQMFVLPDPVFGLLHPILAMGTAIFVVDLRWMLGVQLFGAATWLLPFSLAPPSPQWTLVGYVLLISYAAAGVFRVAALRTTSTLRRLRDESRQREAASLRTAEAVRASEAELRNAQRIARVGSFEWNVATRHLRWSEEHYRIFGWEEAAGPVTVERFHETLHPDDQPRLVEAVAAALRNGNPIDLEYRVRGQDGLERTIHGRGEVSFDPNGRPARLTGTSLDITERKLTEDALQATQERLWAILAALDLDKVVVVDREGTIQSILGEPGSSGRYGITGAQVPGRHVRDFVPGADGDRVAQAIRRIYQTGAPEELEAELELPTGRFHFEVSLRAVRHRSGEVESVLAIVRDQTERRRTESALQQAQKLESLGLLAGGIAHDFNNLLVGILGNAELALSQVDTQSPVGGLLEKILQASERAAELPRQLLAYAGKAKFSAQPLDLARLVDEMVQLLRASLAETLQLETEHGGDRVWIHADSAQIRQVVMNFVTNAVEAVGEAAGHVRVRTDVVSMDRRSAEAWLTHEETLEGKFALLEVSDDGCGMDPRTREQIFDPFFTTKFEGRGLGLASTLGIVRSHGGAIRVESELGRGTTFGMLLPLSTTGPAESEIGSPTPPAGVGTILVVDDEDVVRESLQQMLAHLGYECVGASSGRDALALLASSPARVAAALLDLTMPDMDGAKVFAGLREIRPDLPVVFMSGHSTEELQRRVAGGRGVQNLQKPFRLSEVTSALRAALEG